MWPQSPLACALPQWAQHQFATGCGTRRHNATSSGACSAGGSVSARGMLEPPASMWERARSKGTMSCLLPRPSQLRHGLRQITVNLLQTNDLVL